jgi:hypothetical protein
MDTEQIDSEKEQLGQFVRQQGGEILYLKAQLYDHICQIQALQEHVHDLQHALSDVT